MTLTRSLTLQSVIIVFLSSYSPALASKSNQLSSPLKATIDANTIITNDAASSKGTSTNTAIPSAAPPIAPHFQSQQELNSQITNELEGGLQEAQTNNYAAAQNTFLDVLKKQPENADALYNLGVIQEKQGDLPLALSYYQNALSERPSDMQLQAAVNSINSKLYSTKSPTFTNSMPIYGQPPAPVQPTNPPTKLQASHTNVGHFAATVGRVGLGVLTSAVARQFGIDTCGGCAGLLSRW